MIRVCLLQEVVCVNTLFIYQNLSIDICQQQLDMEVDKLQYKTCLKQWRPRGEREREKEVTHKNGAIRGATRRREIYNFFIFFPSREFKKKNPNEIKKKPIKTHFLKNQN